MPLTFPQYETLNADTTLAPRLKTLAQRLLRDYYKTHPSASGAFLDGLTALSNPAFVERIRVQTLGELDDAGTATPTVAEIGVAARAAIRDCFNNPAL